ncbi:MAG TPA: hypothetical protein VLT45_13130 [Kofleriaceae bacterium]|nr:hypothetical protein [Kofleriaceae bacterium]
MRMQVIVRVALFAVLAALVSACIGDLSTSSDEQAVGTPTITTDKATYTPTQSITVTWTNDPGNANDFIALMPAGSPAHSTPVAWTYINGAVNGSRTFGPIATPGNYEARLYLGGGTYTILAQSSFSVVSTTITTDKSIYGATDTSVVATWANMPGNAGEYVALSVAGSPDNSTIQTALTGGATSGSHTFTKPAPGSYEARAYSSSNTVLARSATFTVVGTTTISTDKTLYTPSQSITVTWSGATGDAHDFIAIMPAGSAAQSTPTEWFYLNGVVSGSKTIPGVAAGSYEARLYLHDSYTILASTSFMVSSTCTVGTAPVVSSVTSGDLTIDAASKYTNVAMTVDSTKSILFTTLAEAEPSPTYGGVMCYLHGALTNPALPAGMLCSRATAGTDTGSGVINVHWTVVTFSSGVTVQSGIANTGTTNPTTVTLNTINPSESFVVLNGILTGGTGWGNNEFQRAQITSSTSLDIRATVAGAQTAWQVVDMTGASVQRGTASFASGDTTQNVTIANAPSGSVPFVSYTTDNSSGIAAAALMLQSRLSNNTTLELKRSAGGAALNIAWEVVSLPFATYSGVTNLAAGQASTSVSIAGISGTQSVGVCSSEGLLGPSTGSTTYAGSSLDLVGEAAATLTTSAGALAIARSSSQASATFPWTVIDFSKNCAGQ